MKKFICALLTLILISSLSSTVFAGFFPEENEKNISFGIKKAEKAPEIDGEFDEGSYFEVALQKGWFSRFVQDDADAPALLDLDVKLYMSWDKDYIYTYTELPSDGHICYYSSNPGMLYMTWCLQICASDIDSTDDKRLEYGTALSSTDDKLISFTWSDYMNSGFVPEASKDFAIIKDDYTIAYECRTPISSFTDKELGDNDQFLYTMVWGMGNGQKLKQLQLASGCCGRDGTDLKNVSFFAKVTLLPGESSGTDTPDTPDTPDTLDTFTLSAILAVATSAAMITVVSRKKH